MRALVVDGDTRAALAIVRSLGKRGIYVVVGSEDEVSLAGCSRWCSERLTYPCPRSFPVPFRDWLVSALALMPEVVLYTASDVTTSIVGKSRLLLPPTARTTLPPQTSLETTMDKSATVDLAVRLGVPAPKSLMFDSGQPVDVERMKWEYPVAIKASQSDLPYRSATTFARNPEELGLRLTEVLCESPSALVQEVVSGEGTAIFALFDSGRPIVTIAHRRLIEKPPWGGVGVLCESISPRPETLSYALRLLEELRWHGVAMVEFKLTAEGVPCLMEINPRFWGSLELAVRSGIDFPYLAFQLANGEKPQPGTPRRAVNRWVLGEIDSLATSLLNGNVGRSRVRDLTSHLWSLRRGLHSEVERLSDPKPALYEYGSWFRISASRMASRRRGGASCGKLTVPGE